MALTNTEILRAVLPNIGLPVNPDGIYRIGVEDINSDEILASLLASGVDLAAIEIINTAIQTAVQGMQAVDGAVGVASDIDGVRQAQLRYMGDRLEAIEVLNTAILASVGGGTGATVTTNTTGVGVAVATLSPGAAFQLVQVRFNVSTGAPLAAGETLTITGDIDAAAVYDIVLYSQDLGTTGINDVVVELGEGYDFAAADDIVIALSANAGGDTWGCQTIHRLL